MDLPTLRTMFALIAFLLFALVMIVQHGRPRSAFGTWWALAMLLYCLSAVTYLAEGQGLQALALPGGRFLLVAGTQCFWASMYSLTGPVRRRWLLPLPSLVLVTTALGDPVADRWAGAAVFFLVMVVVMAGTAHAVRTLPAGYRRVQTPMACAMAVMAAFYVVRLIVFVTVGPQSELFTAFLGPAPSYVLLILLVVVSTFSMTVQTSEIDAYGLRTAATHDDLTGLLNRQGFREIARSEIDRLNRQGVPGALVVMDLDHFKTVNDTHGHPGGDQVLATFARVTRQRVRSTDLLARYGGEEFVLLLAGVTPAEAQKVTAAISRNCAESATAGGIALPTVSFGIAGITHDDGDLDAIVGAADRALYRAKNNGRNQSVVA